MCVCHVYLINYLLTYLLTFDWTKRDRVILIDWQALLNGEEVETVDWTKRDHVILIDWQVLLNGEEVETVDWTKCDHVILLHAAKPGMNRIDVLVENCGRVNYADFNSSLLNNQRKGYFYRCPINNQQPLGIIGSALCTGVVLPLARFPLHWSSTVLVNQHSHSESLKNKTKWSLWVSWKSLQIAGQCRFRIYFTLYTYITILYYVSFNRCVIHHHHVFT